MSKLKEARKAAGLTQKQMADLFKIPRRTIENWDAGTRRPPEWAELLLLEKLDSMKDK